MEDCEICAIELTSTNIRSGICSNCDVRVSFIQLSYEEVELILRWYRVAVFHFDDYLEDEPLAFRLSKAIEEV